MARPHPARPLHLAGGRKAAGWCTASRSRGGGGPGRSGRADRAPGSGRYGVCPAPPPGPGPPGEGGPSSHSPSFPRSHRAGWRTLRAGTRGLGAPLPGSRRGPAVLPRGTQPGGVARWPDSSSPAPRPWRPPTPAQASELRVPGGWAEQGGCGFPPSFPPPPGRILAGVQLPAGLGDVGFPPRPTPHPVLSIPSLHRGRGDLVWEVQALPFLVGPARTQVPLRLGAEV